MENIERILDWMQEKKQLFLLYEIETKKLQVSEEEAIDQIQEALSVREELIGKINEIDKNIQEIFMQTQDGEVLKDVCQNRINYEETPIQYRPLYQVGQEIFQIIARIQQEDTFASTQMQDLMQKLQNRIKQNKQASRVSGYVKSMNYGSSSMNTGFLLNKKR